MIDTNNKTFSVTLQKYVSSELLSNVIRVISGFLVVRSIDPYLYGYFTGFAIYLGYLSLGQGGMIQGLSRELPFQIAKNNFNYANQLADSAFVLTFIISFLVSSIFLVCTIYYIAIDEVDLALISLTYVFLGGLELSNRYFLPTLYKTSREFNLLSRQNNLINVASLLALILVYFYGFYGLLIRAVVISSVEFIFKFKDNPFKLNFNIDFSHIRYMIINGLPIFAASQLVQLWINFLNNLILIFGGALNYGLFGLSNLLQNSLGILPRSVSQVVFPNMIVSYTNGISIIEILKSTIRPLIIQFFILLIICGLGCVLLPVVVPILLPNYKDGITAAQWIIFVPLIQSFSSLANIYATIQKMKYVLYANGLGGIISLIFLYFAHNSSGFSLELYAQTFLIGSFFQQFFLIAFLFRIIKRK